MKVSSAEDEWEDACLVRMSVLCLQPSFRVFVQGHNPEMMWYRSRQYKMAECLQRSWKFQWVNFILIDFILGCNCAQSSHVDWAIIVRWSGSCVRWIMVNWGLREWTNRGCPMWKRRTPGHYGIDYRALVYCISFDPLYGKKIVEDT